MPAAPEFVDLEKKLYRFYAPAFEVRVGGEDLRIDLKMDVLSVQVDNSLEGADQFNFVINDRYDLKSSEFDELLDFFSFGKPVKILMGYRDRLELMIHGIVTTVNTSFPAQGLPQITVSGYDLSYCMMKRVGSKNWDNTTDSAVVAELARQHKLNPKVKDTQVVLPKVEQNQESDFQLIRKLAERNGYEFFVYDEDLHFVPPANDEGEVVVLERGRGLYAFVPEVNLAEQINAVEVRGWDPKTRKEIVGRASRGDEPGLEANRKSGAEYVRSICSDATLRVRYPVFSKQEADRKAKALLKKRSEAFIKGSGEIVGIPELRPNRNIRLEGLGSDFSRTYYIEQTTHTVSSSGYRTTFRVKDTTI